MEVDVMGQALRDYWGGDRTEDIATQSSLEEVDILPLAHLFRSHDEMPRLEQKALSLARGKVLDIGCGAGGHSLYLQEKGLHVTALDKSPGAIAVCRERGLTHTVCSDFITFSEGTYDTLLLLMNGLGIVGKLAHLDAYLRKMKSLLRPQGQILLDSSDILYMYPADADGGHWLPDTLDYYGEVTFTLTYKEQKSAPFEWLYLDFNTLQRAVQYHGLQCDLVMEGEHFDFLARIYH
jgi:SAM-dependent methyltransferase